MIKRIGVVLAVLFVGSGCAHQAETKPAPPPAEATLLPPPTPAKAAPTPVPAASTVDKVHATRAKHGTCGDGKPLRVHFYDVGQALSALVTFPDGTHWLVDAGTGATGASKRLTDSLTADLAGTPISVMWISHQHADHNNAAEKIMGDFTVKAYVDNGYPSKAHTAASAKKILHTPTDDLPMPAGPVKITPFLPTSKIKACPSNQNDCSIGLRIEYCDSSILFVGDAESDEEARLPQDQTATLLQVGHHGSPTSSSSSFVKAISPKYAVISAGKPREGTNKTYCHPNAATVATLNSVLPEGNSKPLEAFAGDGCRGSTEKDWTMAQANEHIWATERDGDVILESIGDGSFNQIKASK